MDIRSLDPGLVGVSTRWALITPNDSTDLADEAHLNIIISNAQREAIRLNSVRLGIGQPGREWTDAEKDRASQLFSFDQQIEAIREASNFLEPDAPADFADDSNWP